jgi:hypothetical protein
VPAGGLRPDALRWCRPKSADFFLPQSVLAARFRTRLQAALQALPEATDIPAAVWRQKWVVDVQPVGSGQAALTYLSAYVYHTALGSQRLLKDEEGQITFKYKGSDDGQWHPLSVSAPEFIRRFLQHVLPRGFQRVRYYGWLSAAATARWQRILSLLDWKAPTRQVLSAAELICCGLAPSCGLLRSAPSHAPLLTMLAAVQALG